MAVHDLISTAPINAIPPELLQKIFSTCTGTGLVTPRKRESPWILTQVCTTWRRLAIAHQALWSSLTIAIGHPEFQVIWIAADGEETGGMCNPPFSVIASFLERSGTHPLSVTLHVEFSRWNSDIVSEIPRRIFQLIHAHMNHMKTFSIQVPSSVDADEATEESFPLLIPAPNDLESLHVKNKPQFIDSLNTTDFPRLRCFGWTGDASKALGMAIPWSQLRKLSLRSVEFNHYVDCFRVLKETPNLVTLELSIIDDCEEEHCVYRGSNVVLSSLTRLDITGTPLGLLAVLPRMQMHHLEHLRLILHDPLYPEEEDSEKIFTHIYTHFKAKQSALKTLSLKNLLLPARLLIRLLGLLSSSLVHLELDGFPTADQAVLNALAVPHNGQEVLCPRLLSLSLIDCVPVFSSGSLARVVESRISRYRLSHMEVTINAQLSSKYQEDHQRLVQLNSRGKLPFLRWDTWEEEW